MQLKNRDKSWESSLPEYPNRVFCHLVDYLFLLWNSNGVTERATSDLPTNESI